MKKTIFSLLILLLFIFLALKTINVPEILHALQKINPTHLIYLIALSVFIHIIKGYRYYVVNKALKINTNFLSVLKAFTAAQALSIIPGGDAVKPMVYAKEEDISKKEAIVPFINQAFFEISIPIIISLLGSFFYHEIRSISIILIIIMALIAIILLNKKLTNSVFNVINNKKYNKVASLILYIQNNLFKTIVKPQHTTPRKTFYFQIFLTSLTTCLSGFLLYLISNSVGIQTPFFLAIFIYSAGSVISNTAVLTPGGSGFTEGGMVGLYLLTKVSDYSTALTAVIVFRLITYFLFLIIGLGVLLLFYRNAIFHKNSL